MLDTAHNARFAKSCTDAAFGYAQAATAAYGAVAQQTLDFWSQAASAGSHRTDGWGAASNPFAASFPAQMALAPMTAWWGMFPLRGNPACWPMAYGMMAAGVPSAVAWPTAQANEAALDAAEAATDTLNEAFSVYRSAGGHASAQIMGPRALMAALAMVLPMGALAPWALAPPGSGF